MRPRSALPLAARTSPRTGGEVVIAKLSRFVTLNADDRTTIEHLCWNVRRVSAQRDIVSEGDRPLAVHVIFEGWALRYKTLRDGGRHIPALLIPGDFCDLRAIMLDRMDHGIAAITPVRVASISHAEFVSLVDDRSNLMRALHWATLVDLAVLRTWMVGLSGRSALSRIAHLLCEIRDRSFAIGVGNLEQFSLPLTQMEFADATGQTAVHVNRIVRQLHIQGLASVHDGAVTIFNRPGLEYVAEYDPRYLHLDEAQRSFA